MKRMNSISDSISGVSEAPGPGQYVKIQSSSVKKLMDIHGLSDEAKNIIESENLLPHHCFLDCTITFPNIRC